MKQNNIRNFETFDLSKPFKIYRNLNKKGWFSILGYNSHSKSYLLFSHCQNFFCKNVSFKVSEKSRQRAIATETRNVHAFALVMAPDLFLSPTDINTLTKQKISYNPFKGANFYISSTGNPLHFAKYVYFDKNEIFMLV